MNKIMKDWSISIIIKKDDSKTYFLFLIRGNKPNQVENFIIKLKSNFWGGETARFVSYSAGQILSINERFFRFLGSFENALLMIHK